MEFPKYFLLSVHGDKVGNSRSTPNRPGATWLSPFWHLHLEKDSFSEAVMGWSRDLCIQLASIVSLAVSDQLSAIS